MEDATPFEAFGHKTIDVILEYGWDDFEPVLVDLRGEPEYLIILGVPAEDDTTALLHTASKEGLSKGPFLFSVRLGPREVAVGEFDGVHTYWLTLTPDGDDDLAVSDGLKALGWPVSLTPPGLNPIYLPRSSEALEG